MGELHVVEWGDGERAVLVHGSFGWGEETFREQRPLADRFRLVVPDRRGFGGTPRDGRVDFERDAVDIAALLGEQSHLVGHSYGGVVTLLAAASRPEAVRSLTVIEPPALSLVRGDPKVEEIIERLDRAAAEAESPSDYRSRFLRGFGFAGEPQALEGRDLEAARSSQAERPPWEAEIPLAPLAGVRTLVARGDWSTAPESAREAAGDVFRAVCEALAAALGAESAVFPSAHNPQLLGEPFNDRLRAFWEGAS